MSLNEKLTAHEFCQAAKASYQKRPSPPAVSLRREQKGVKDLQLSEGRERHEPSSPSPVALFT